MLFKLKGKYINAVQWTGSNLDEVVYFCPDITYRDHTLFIPMPTHDRRVGVGSYIVKDPFLPTRYLILTEDEFNERYEPA